MVTSQRRNVSRPAWSLVPLALVTLLVTGLVSACGSSDDGGDPAPPPAADSPAPPAPLEQFSSLTDIGTATAAQQKIDKTAHITVTGGQTGPSQNTITGDGALRFDDAGPAMQLTEQLTSGGGTPVELGLVVLPDAAFVRPPPTPGLVLPAGKPWVRVDPASTDPASKQFGRLVQAIRENADPTRSFAQFGDAITIADSAQEQLDGTPAVRYRLKVDMVRAVASQPDPAIKQNLQQSVQSGLTSLEYTLWLDGQNRLLRVLVDQPLPQNQGNFTMDAHYRDWGQPVQIDQPPASQVQVR